MTDNMELVQTREQANLLISRIQKADSLSVDTESSGPNLLGKKFVNMFRATTTGVSFCFDDKKCFYMPIAHRQGNLSLGYVNRVGEALQNEKVSLWAHNWKHDLKAFDQLGWNLRGCDLADTQIMLWLLGLKEPGKSAYGLKAQAFAKLGLTMSTFEETVGAGDTFSTLTPEDGLQYAAEDALAVQLLKEKYFADLLALDLGDAWNRELRMVRVLRHMEDTGIEIDDLRISRLYQEVHGNREQLLAEWDWLVGGNPSSPKQVNENLYEYGLWSPLDGMKSKKTGLYPTNKEAVNMQLALCKPGSVGHRAAELKLELNALAKIETTYSMSLIENAGQYPDGRLHPNYHGTGTETGRLSSSYPNGQNIPIRTELGKRVQECFGVARGNCIVSADYSQIELRVMAHLAGSGPLFDGYRAGADVHQATADDLGCTRDQGKTINFAILYGAGARKMAKQIGVELPEAKRLLLRWRKNNSSVVDKLDSIVQSAYSTGMVRLESGRIRRLPEMRRRDPLRTPRLSGPHSEEQRERHWDNVLKPRFSDERRAGNTAVQGFAADIVKQAMVEIYDALVVPGHVRMQAQVHDDIKLEVNKDYADRAASKMQEIMEQAWKLRVPLLAEPAIGANWLEAK